MASSAPARPASARTLAAGMAVQALGAAATLLTGLLIAYAAGPEAQAHYGLLRTTADLLLALALLGLPQSLVHAIHQQGLSPSRAAHASWRYAAVWLALIVVVAALWNGLAALWPAAALPGWIADWRTQVALALCVAGWLVQGLWRVLVLCVGDALSFAWASVLPSLTLLAAVALALALGAEGVAWPFLVSGLASALFAHAHLQPLRMLPAWRRGGALPWSTLAAGGALASAQAAALALQPWLTLLLLRRAGAEAAEVGCFVFAMLVHQAFTLPASFAAPLLLERVSRARAAGERHAPGRWLLPLLALVAAAAVAAALLLPWGLPRAFGPAYDAAVKACIWMAVSGPFVVAGRLAVAVLLGQGAFGAAAWHAAARCIAVAAAVGAALALRPGDRAAAAALAWLATEALLCALAVWLARMARRTEAMA